MFSICVRRCRRRACFCFCVPVAVVARSVSSVDGRWRPAVFCRRAVRLVGGAAGNVSPGWAVCAQRTGHVDVLNRLPRVQPDDG